MSRDEKQERKDRFETISEEFISSFCEIVQGGKAPKVVFGCRVQVNIDKIDQVPDMIINNIRETWTKAQDENLIARFF